MVFDKTGTITRGQPELTDILAFENDQKEIFKIASSLEQNSEHPLSKAMLKKAKKENIELYKLKDFKAIAGKGLKGILILDNGEETQAHLGNKSLMRDLGLDLSPHIEDIGKLENQGKTVMILVVQNKIKAVLAMADVIKEEAGDVFRDLESAGIETWMLTGDNQKTAEAIARQAGIKNIMAEILPGKNLIRYANCNQPVKKSRWLATALTTRRRLPSPMSA